MSNLKQWFRQKIQGSLLGPLRSSVYERFMDMEQILYEGEDDAGQVKLWSVFRMHCPEMRRALDRLCQANPDMNLSGAGELDMMMRDFNERVDSAKEMVLSWQASDTAH